MGVSLFCALPARGQEPRPVTLRNIARIGLLLSLTFLFLAFAAKQGLMTAR